MFPTAQVGHLGSGASVWGSQYPPWPPGKSSHFCGSGALSPRARPHLSEASKCPSKTMHRESGFLLNENQRIHSQMICLQSRASLTGGNPITSWAGGPPEGSAPCDMMSAFIHSPGWTYHAGDDNLNTGSWKSLLWRHRWFMGADFFFNMDILKSCQIVLMKYSGSGGAQPRLKTRWW